MATYTLPDGSSTDDRLTWERARWAHVQGLPGFKRLGRADKDFYRHLLRNPRYVFGGSAGMIRVNQSKPASARWRRRETIGRRLKSLAAAGVLLPQAPRFKKNDQRERLPNLYDIPGIEGTVTSNSHIEKSSDSHIDQSQSLSKEREKKGDREPDVAPEGSLVQPGTPATLNGKPGAPHLAPVSEVVQADHVGQLVAAPLVLSELEALQVRFEDAEKAGDWQLQGELAARMEQLGWRHSIA